MTEILHTCPCCAQRNFSERGLRAHRCRAIGRQRLSPSDLEHARQFTLSQAMPKASSKALVKANKPIDLDVIEPGQISHDAKFDADAMAKRVKAMFAEVDRHKKERVLKAILTGIYLHEVRIALQHGQFMAWKKKHFAKDNATLARYMSLAAVFSRKAKLLLPEMVGANQLTLELGAQDSDGRSLLAKLEKFVGAEGLTSLMQKHGVLAAPPPKSPISNTPAATTLAEQGQLSDQEQHEQAIADLRRAALDTLTAFDEIGQRWQLLTDAQLQVTLRDCEQLAAQIRGWLKTPQSQRAAFDPAPFISGEAEKALLARRHEGTAFASLAA